MNEEHKFYKPEFVIKNDTPRVKKLGLRLTVTDNDLKDEVKKAFDLAKIAGQELDLVFTHSMS
ncbi:MAG: hypothetical protein ABSA45_01820 [Verrucomicrobiota bacterium]